jgi:hypothetical protein
MIIVMKCDATEAQIQAVVDKLISHDFDVHRSTGVERTVLGVVGAGKPDPGEYMELDGVKEVIRISKDE